MRTAVDMDILLRIRPRRNIREQWL